jgi:polyphosphate kinase 2 (PPK2 family)
MLEHVDLTVAVPKEEYQQRLPALRLKLYNLEHSMFKANMPVMVVFEGWAAAGQGTVIKLLTERLDARGFRVVPVTPPRTYETHYPWLWRFWQKIPAYGQMVIYDGSWYRRVLVDRVNRNVSRRQWQDAYHDINDFEEQLANDGTKLVKFWLHISQKEQAKRFKKLLKRKLTAWQVSEEDAAQYRAYDKYLAAVEEMLERTDTPYAPWSIIEATDRYHTCIKVYETLIAVLAGGLGE